MLIRREVSGDIEAIRAVHAAAFEAPAGQAVPVEPGLVDALRACDAWQPSLSLFALAGEQVVGHVVCSRAHVGGLPALGLGPLGVLPEHQRSGVGGALMHAVLGAADALNEPLVVLLGHTGYYPRFGFRPAAEYGVTPPVPEWAEHFQARPLTAYRSELRGQFTYAQPFNDL